MNLKKHISVLFLIFSCLVFSQSTKDSLLNIIKQYKFNDTIQCNRILSYIELEEDTNSWMAYNDILLKLTKEKLNKNISRLENKKYNYYLGQYYNNRGFYYAEIKNHDLSLKYYKNAETIFKKINDLNSLALIYQNIGTHYDEIGQTLKILPYYNEVLKIRVQLKDDYGLAMIYSDLGRYYADNGAETKGINYLTKSLLISDKIKNEILSNRNRRFMSVIFANQKEYEQSLNLIIKDIEYCKKVNDNRQLSLTYLNIATIYNRLNKFNLMIKYNNLGLNIALKNKYNNQISLAYQNKYDYFLINKVKDSLLRYAKLNLKYGSVSKEEPHFTEKKLCLSQAYKLNEKYNIARTIGIEIYKRANEMKYPDLIMKSAKNLKEIYIATNDKSKALDYALIEIKMKDSLSSINIKNSAIKSLFKYETEKKEATIKDLDQKKKIAELESTRKTTTLYLLGLFFVAVATTAFVLFSRFKEKKKNETLQNKLAETEKLLEVEKKASESELKALKSQMNPHFIFNALNSIQTQFMFGDKLKANEQLSNFTYLTRQILEVSGKKQIAISEEVDILTKYLDLEKMRFSEDFDYQISISKNIDEDYHKVPPMLIQPIVENSMKHGLLHKNGNKLVTINFDIDDDESYILCTVEDNGVGREKSATIKSKSNLQHKSFSTQSINERLELLNNNLKLNDLVVYEDVVNDKNEVCGTKVVLKIPLV